nr:MFS transporter [Anaerolineae bacterium]
MTAKSNDERVVSQTKDVGFQIGGRKTFAIAPTENKWTFCLSSTSLSFETRPPARELALQVGVATLGRFVFNTSRRFVYPFAPALSRGLGVPLTAITSLIAINQATGLLSPFFGPVSDRWGYRVMMLAGLGMLAVGMFASGVLPLYGIIMIALFLAGLGKSIFDPALLAYLGERVPFHRRGLVIGVTEFARGAGALGGIPLARVLIDPLGRQAPFLTLGGLSLLCLAGLAF